MTTKPDRIPLMKSVMTPFPWSVTSDDSISKAKSLMGKHDVRHLPVTKGGELVSVITERDIRLLESITMYPKARQALRVGDASVYDAFIVDAADPLDGVLIAMSERHIGSALVVRGEQLVGIFTVTDACRSYGDFLRAMFPETDDQTA